MTTMDQPAAAAEAPELVAVLPETIWDRVDALLARASDYLNPILVKEARQALRSRQFLITFFLMLAAGWAWSILGLAAVGPSVYYAAAGPQLFFGYHLILSFPLLVVAPYSAFHSLSSERQDRTYDLVSITTLGARQILSGKLGGIVLQMMVYMSAIFPCLAFTYLLRGLDIFTILLAVLYTSCLSISLSVLGLLLATIAPLRQRHIGLSVFFALLLFGAMWADNMWTSALVFWGGFPPGDPEFWVVQMIFVTLFVNFFAIVFLAARSQLMAVSQNRSTALRWGLVAAQLSFFAWMAWAQLMWGGEMVYGLIYFSTVGWFVVGMFLTAEPCSLSPRVKRDLPQSTLARTFLTWFTPGPGTGYMFVLANMLVVMALAMLPYDWIRQAFHAVGAVAGQNITGTFNAPGGVLVHASSPRATRPEVFGAALTAICYLAIYLGLASLLVRALRRVVDVRLALPVMINVLLVLLGAGVPWVIQMTSPTLRNMGYSLMQITNPVWTLSEVCFRRAPYQMPLLLIALPAAAILVWLANLLPLLEDLKQVRIAPPKRVEEEDAQAAALRAGPAGPKSPWD
jgi:hypothetical protein